MAAPTSFWTLGNLRKEALKYTSRSAFKAGSHAAYRASVASGKHELICKHIPNKRFGIRRDVAEALEIAKSYSSRARLQQGDAATYQFLRLNKLLAKACQHMKRPEGNSNVRYIYIIFSSVGKTAYVGLTQNPNKRIKQHLQNGTFAVRLLLEKPHTIEVKPTRYTSEKAALAEIRYIKKLKSAGFNVVNVRLGGDVGGGYRKWTKEAVTAEASKYNKRSDFKYKSNRAYSVACTEGWMDEICSHMPKVATVASKWTHDSILDCVEHCSDMKDFYTNHVGAYNKARALGMLSEIQPLLGYRRKTALYSSTVGV